MTKWLIVEAVEKTRGLDLEAPPLFRLYICFEPNLCQPHALSVHALYLTRILCSVFVGRRAAICARCVNTMLGIGDARTHIYNYVRIHIYMLKHSTQMRLTFMIWVRRMQAKIITYIGFERSKCNVCLQTGKKQITFLSLFARSERFSKKDCFCFSSFLHFYSCLLYIYIYKHPQCYAHVLHTDTHTHMFVHHQQSVECFGWLNNFYTPLHFHIFLFLRLAIRYRNSHTTATFSKISIEYNGNKMKQTWVPFKQWFFFLL